MTVATLLAELDIVLQVTEEALDALPPEGRRRIAQALFALAARRLAADGDGCAALRAALDEAVRPLARTGTGG